MLSLPIRVWSETLCATLEVPSEARFLLDLAGASSKSSGELSRSACTVVRSASASCSLGRCLGGLPLFCLIWKKRNRIKSNQSTIEKKKQKKEGTLVRSVRTETDTRGAIGCFGWWSWIFHLLICNTHSDFTLLSPGLDR